MATCCHVVVSNILALDIGVRRVYYDMSAHRRNSPQFASRAGMQTVMGGLKSHQRDLQRTRCRDDNDCPYTESLLMTIGSFRKYTKDEQNVTHTPCGVSDALRLGHEYVLQNNT